MKMIHKKPIEGIFALTPLQEGTGFLYRESPISDSSSGQLSGSLESFWNSFSSEKPENSEAKPAGKWLISAQGKNSKNNIIYEFNLTELKKPGDKSINEILVGWMDRSQYILPLVSEIKILCFPGDESHMTEITYSFYKEVSNE